MAGDITGTPEVNKVIINNEVILDLTQDTVTTDKMVSGVTAHDKSGKQIAGTMGELAGLAYTGGAITTPGSGGSYSIPASYIPEETRYVKGNDETVVNVTIPRTKFASAEGIAQTGSMAEVYRFATRRTQPFIQGDSLVCPSFALDSANEFMTGYVNKGIEYNVFVPMTAFGTAQSGNVLKGRTYTSANGLRKAGTMPNNGAAAIQLSDLTAKSVTAGYYSGGTAKIADAEAAKIIPENIKKGVTILGVEGTMEASAGGDYNIAATTNSDGTQNLAITDAGGGSSGGGSGETGTTSLTVRPGGGRARPILCSWQTDSGWLYTTKFDTSASFTLPNVLIGGYVVLSIGPDSDASFSAHNITGVEPIDPVGLDSTVDTYDVSLALKITSANPVVSVGLIS